MRSDAFAPRPSVHSMQATPVPGEPRTRPAASSGALRAHLARHHAGAAPLRFSYAPGPAGVDSNLLVLLHGLGDTMASFQTLGRSLQNTLPQTAVLSVQAPLRVPLLEEEAWMWWESFDALGECTLADLAYGTNAAVNTRPDPRHAIEALSGLLGYLRAAPEDGGCGWPAQRIHLFGYAQGGSLVLETLIALRTAAQPVCGSAVSVCGPLLSLPTFSPPLDTPVCLVTRFPAAAVQSSTQARSVLAAVHKAFKNVTHVNFPPKGPMLSEDMVRGAEWPKVLEFWSRFLKNRSAWELQGDLYTVT